MFVVHNVTARNQKMLNEPLSVEGPDFASFSKENIEGVLLCPSMVVLHKTLGLGAVESVVPRLDHSPLFSICFSNSHKISRFNLGAFESGMLSVVGLPPVLAAEFRAWKIEFERIKAEREEAEKLARIKKEDEEKLAREYGRELETRVTPFFGYMEHASPYASALEYIEKREAAKNEHYRKSLPSRIEWLKEWALKISQGESGLEPAWSEGRAAADYLKDKGISSLWHFTDIRNLPHIVESGGLLSHLALAAMSAEVWRCSNNESIRRDRSLGRDDSVRLSFVPNSFFFQRVSVSQNPHLIWLRFSPKALSLGDVVYSRGNAASEFASLHYRPDALGLDWKLLKSFSGCLTENGPPLSYPKLYASEWEDPESTRMKKITLNSEVMVKHFLPMKFCTGIFDIKKLSWIWVDWKK